MKKISKTWLTTIGFLTVVAIGAFILRIINLTVFPVFADEAIYIRWSQIMANEPTLRFLPLSDGKQPLYMWILMFIVHKFSAPLFIGRFISVGSGISTLVGVFCLSYVLFKNKFVSIIAAVLWALSPYAFFFDRMALVDALLATLSVWTAVFAILGIKYAKLDMSMIAGFFLGLAALTKSPALFIALLVPTTLQLVDWTKGLKLNFEKLIIRGLLIGIIYFIAFGMYNILRLGPEFHLLSSRTADYVFPLSHFFENPKDPFIFHFDRSIEWLMILGPWPLLALIGVTGINIKNYTKEKIFLLGWWLFPVAVQSEFARVFTARYILFTLPFVISLAASSLMVKSKYMRNIVYVLLTIFAFLSVRFNYLLITDPVHAPLPKGERSGYLEEWSSGVGIEKVAEYIEQIHAKNPNQKIVVGTEGYFGTLPDGLQIYLQDVPNVTTIGIGLGIKEVPAQLREAKKAGDKVYLVANDSRFNFQEKGGIEKLGLQVVAKYQKADRRTDANEYKQFGPVETLYLFEVVDPSGN